MLVKVCGMREEENIRAVEKLPVGLIGFIFYPRSPRYVDAQPRYMPRSAGRVGVFVNEELHVIEETIARYGLTHVQLHGSETPDLCRTLKLQGVQVIKAFSVAVADDLTLTREYAASCDLFLFDTPTSRYGGSGRSFDWEILQHYTGTVPFLLSGGIGEDDAAKVAAFRHPRFAGVDLNSRFELSPGIKDIEKLNRFIKKIKDDEPNTTTVRP